MQSSRLLLSALAVTVLSASVARADTFDFTFGTLSNTFNGSGTFTGTELAAGEFEITGVTGVTNTTGNHNNSSIESAGGFENNDNLLFVSSSGVGSLDLGGISYFLANGAQINLKTTASGDTEILERANGNVVDEAVNFSITAATPEPGSFVLLGTGLLGVVGAARRRLFA